jgi:hypothetical protein
VSLETTLVELENIMLSEIARLRKTNAALSHSYGKSTKVNLMKVEKRMGVTRCWKRWGEHILLILKILSSCFLR